ATFWRMAQGSLFFEDQCVATTTERRGPNIAPDEAARLNFSDKEQMVMATGIHTDDRAAIARGERGPAAAHEQRSLSSRVEAVGRGVGGYGLVVVVGWIGLMKFTAYEAEGIRPFVAHSPLMSWVYGLMSVQGFSAVLGVIEVAIATLIAARHFSHRA